MLRYGYALGGAALSHRGPAAQLFNFTTGVLPTGFAVARSDAAARFNSAGNLEIMTANTARLSYLPGQGSTASDLLVEAATTNLIGHTALTTADLSSSGATLANLSLGALGLLPGVSVAATSTDWNRALRNVTLTGGQTYAMRLFVGTASASASTLMVMFKNGTTSQSSQAHGTIDALGVSNPTAGALTLARQDLLKDAQTWAIDLTFVPTSGTTYSIGVGPFTSVPGASIILLAWQIELAASPSSLVLDGAGDNTRAAETVTAPMAAGLYEITAEYADGTNQTLTAQSLASGQWSTLSKHHVARLSYVGV